MQLEQDHDDVQRHTPEDIHDTLHQQVGPAAVVTFDRAVERAENEAHDGHAEGEHEGRAQTVGHTGGDIIAAAVGAEHEGGLVAVGVLIVVIVQDPDGVHGALFLIVLDVPLFVPQEVVDHAQLHGLFEVDPLALLVHGPALLGLVPIVGVGRIFAVLVVGIDHGVEDLYVVLLFPGLDLRVLFLGDLQIPKADDVVGADAGVTLDVFLARLQDDPLFPQGKDRAVVGADALLPALVTLLLHGGVLGVHAHGHQVDEVLVVQAHDLGAVEDGRLADIQPGEHLLVGGIGLLAQLMH